MRRIAVWYVLLNKRLFHRWSFLLILGMVPVLAAGMRLASQGEKGVVSVALCMEDEEEALCAQIRENLLGNSQVLRYKICSTPQQAREMVENFQADAAWIFPANLKERLWQAAADRQAEPVVEVIEREDSVPLRFSREILCSALFPAFSYAVYEDFVAQDLGLLEGEEALRKAYEATLVEGSLFRIVYFDGSEVQAGNYLLTPLRGIFSLWLVLCVLAASLYYLQDEQRGVFSWMPLRHRFWFSFGYLGVVLSDAVVVMLVSCRLAGVFTEWSREVPNALLFAGCALVFGNLVRLLCGTARRLGSCIPLLLMVMALVCPVFVTINSFLPLQRMFPVFYYLKATYSTYHGWLMFLYMGAGLCLCALTDRFRRWMGIKKKIRD